MNDDPSSKDDEFSRYLRSKPKRYVRLTGIRLVDFLALAAVVVDVAFFLMPTTPRVPDAARRTYCRSQLHQIGLALSAYESEYGSLPPAYTVDASGKPLHSWRTLILPFLDQRQLYEKIDLSKPWDDPVNLSARQALVQGYQCYSAKLPRESTTYLAVVASNGSFRSKGTRKLSGIPAPDQTIMIIEAPLDKAVHWMSPVDADLQTITGLDLKSKTSHAGGIHVLLADGNARFLSWKMPLAQRLGLIPVEKEGKMTIDW